MKKKLYLLCLLSLSLISCNQEHIHSFEIKIEGENHYQKCQCGEIVNYGKHSGGTSTCTNLAICEVCGEKYGELKEHNFVIPRFDEEGHYDACECSSINNKLPHRYEEGIIKVIPTDVSEGREEFKCIDCEYVKEETLSKIKGYEVDTYPSLSNADVVAYKDVIYTYGGSPDGSGRTNSIYAFDTRNDKLYKLNVKLPKESTSHRVSLIGDKVYIFGGLNKNGRIDSVLVHDLTSQTLEELEVKMPYGVNCAQIGQYGETIYLFGGMNDSGVNAQIIEYKISSNKFEILDVSMPEKISKGAWVSIGKYCYLIGGTGGKRLTTIYRFDMETHTFEKMNGALSIPLSQARALYDGQGNIYIYGGTNEQNQLLTTIYKYNIESDECVLENIALPYNLANTCVAYVNGSSYILGGDNAITNIILKHTKDTIINLMNNE